MIHIGSLKKDMIILEKSEFSALRNENEVLRVLENFFLRFFLLKIYFCLEIKYGNKDNEAEFK